MSHQALRLVYSNKSPRCNRTSGRPNARLPTSRGESVTPTTRSATLASNWRRLFAADPELAHGIELHLAWAVSELGARRTRPRR